VKRAHGPPPGCGLLVAPPTDSISCRAGGSSWLSSSWRAGAGPIEKIACRSAGRAKRRASEPAPCEAGSGQVRGVPTIRCSYFKFRLLDQQRRFIGPFSSSLLRSTERAPAEGPDSNHAGSMARSA